VRFKDKIKLIRRVERPRPVKAIHFIYYIIILLLYDGGDGDINLAREGTCIYL